MIYKAPIGHQNQCVYFFTKQSFLEPHIRPFSSESSRNTYNLSGK
jgi:hypothetical protein